MGTSPSFTSLGSLEQQIMDALWEQSPLDVAGVRAAIKSDRAYSTIKTVLERLTDKGILTRQKVGRAFEYRPTLSAVNIRRGRHVS